jgi:hypothetical protein
MSAVTKVIRAAVIAFCRENAIVQKDELEAYAGAQVRAQTGLDAMPGLVWAEALSMLATGKIRGMEKNDTIGVANIGAVKTADESDPRQTDMWENDE